MKNYNLHQLEEHKTITKKFSFSERCKFNFLDYQLQFFKAYQFLELNEEGVN